MEARELIREVPDFPRPGIVFQDLTPLFADGPGFAGVIDALTARFADAMPTKVVGIEARGFIVAAPVAIALGAGFVPVRKVGKLPWERHTQSYELEYGTDSIEIHVDAVEPGDRVLVLDDLIATGGTAAATVELLERIGATVVGLGFVVEISGLGGRERLGRESFAVVTV